MKPVVAAAVLLLGAGCSSQNSPGAAPAQAGGTGPAVVTGRAPAGALVTLEPTSGSAPLPEGGALMDQYGKAFVPEILFVRVGQPVTFRNSEDQLHNVTVIRSRTGAGVFNISQNPFENYLHTFDQPGEFDVSCDVHPGMRATIVAATTPYAVYADRNGAFSIPSVPQGSYTLRVSADGRATDRVVDVTGSHFAVK